MDDRVAGRLRQRVVDEVAVLERELAQAWPDPRRARAELEDGARALLALRAEALELERLRRFMDLAIVGAWVAALALCVVIACFLGGCP